MCGVWCCVRVAHAHVCLCGVCSYKGGVSPFFMPTLRGAVGCLWCSRIRDYVNPWSVPGCGCGGAGVFVITDSYWWFPDKREHTNNHTSATGSLHRVHKTHKYSQPSRLHRYVISDIHSMLRTPVSNNHFTRSEILRVDALGVVEPTSMTMAKYVQYLSNAKP